MNSLEGFFHTYKSGRIFRAEVNPRSPQSPPVQLADAIAIACGNGLRQFRYSYERQTFTLPRNVIESKSGKPNPIMDYIGILFGKSVVALEQTLVDGYLDLDEYIDSINRLLRPTVFNKLPPPAETAEPLRMTDHAQMLEVARRDPTLASFFREDMQALPDKIMGLLNLTHAQSGRSMHFHITNNLLDQYYNRAMRLIVPPVYPMEIPEAFNIDYDLTTPPQGEIVSPEFPREVPDDLLEQLAAQYPQKEWQ